MSFRALWHLQWVRRLPTLEVLTSGGECHALSKREHVRGSVVIAARDEEARIEGTLRHLLAQRGIEAEFIVVDELSTDRTGDGEVNQSPR